MTEKITTTLYRYKVSAQIQPYHFDDTLFFYHRDEQIDELIGGVAFGINEGHIVFHIYDVDESLFTHPWVIWWDKQVIENEVTITKLPTKKSRNVSWKSRNRGGGIKHKNFDKSDAKLYYSETERPPKKPNKPIAKTITEPPMGIMGIIKKEDCDD
jgi:hypothetical protein